MKTYPPFFCPLCDQAIKQTHVILTPLSRRGKASPDERNAAAGVMVCGRCMDDKTAHSRLFPGCDAAGYCDLYDHAEISCADRRAAVVVLTRRGQMNPEATLTTTDRKVRP